MTRTFSEMALCHLPDYEIQSISLFCLKGMTVVYKNEAGFFIWAKARVPDCPVLMKILASATTDFVLFDLDVEPDPDLEIYEE